MSACVRPFLWHVTCRPWVMDAAPAIANLSPATIAAAVPTGPPGAGVQAAEVPGAFGAAMTAVAETGPETAAGRGPTAEEAGTAVPEGGHELPFVAGMLPSAPPLPVAPAVVAGEAVAPRLQMAASVAGGARVGLPDRSPGARAAADTFRAVAPGQHQAADSGTAGFVVAVSRGPDAAGGAALSAAAGAQRFATPFAATGGITPPSDAMTEPGLEAEVPSVSPLPSSPPPALPVVPRAPLVIATLQGSAVRSDESLRGPTALDGTGAPVTTMVGTDSDSLPAPEATMRPATEALAQASVESPQTTLAAVPAPPGPRPADAPTVMQLATAVTNPGWSDGLADRVAWMVQQDLGQAHLKLNPPQLGPVEVRVQVSSDQATVTFTAHNQQVRDALENASQRLRDLLGSQGFVNVQVDVSQHPFHERPLPAQHYDEGTGEMRSASGPSAPGPSVRDGQALLDAYA